MREYHWQVVARSISAAFLALAAIGAHLLGFLKTPWPALGVCGVILAYNAALIFVRTLGTRPAETTLASLILDLLSLTAYLHFTGDIENPLMVAYSLPVVAGAVILSRRAAFLLAGLACLLFLALMVMTTLDACPIQLAHYHLALLGDLALHDRIDPDLSPQGWNYILTHLLVLLAVLFGSAHGFGTLRERLREKEEDLRRENERLLLLLGILPEGVVLLDPDGSILHANPAAHERIGAAAGGRIDGLDARLDLPLRLRSFSGPVQEFETPSGDRVLEHALARKTVGGPIVWVFRDTTEQRQLQAQLMHRSKMVDLGLLAAGIAHEIGNPLSSMSALLQLIQIKAQAPGLTERLSAVESHIERISRIVQDITGFARPSAGAHRRVEAAALLDKALQIFRFHDKAREIRVDVAPPESVVLDVVEDQIVQVLLNLLLNAADASRGRGTVDVRIRREGAEARIAVRDRGTGMTRQTQDRLFTPFFTTKEQGSGTGLGLFISESIARAHDGRIDVSSAPGEGSTFVLCLPLAGETLAA